MTTLLDTLSELDKKRIANYVLKYGGIYSCKGDFFRNKWESNSDFLNLWLADWAKNKKKLYRLLGNSLIFTKKVKIDVDTHFFYEEINHILNKIYDKYSYLTDDKNSGYNDTTFFHYMRGFDFYELLNKDDSVYYDELGKEEIEKYNENKSFYEYIYRYPVFELIASLFQDYNCYEGIANRNIRIKRTFPDGTFKLLKINKNEKLIKARLKVLEFFEVFKYYPLYEEQFNYFAKNYNELRAIKNRDALLCLSIHPLDFMTMSDNNSGWTSCMAWADEEGGGCYRVGTVEMMNSNMTICAYLLPEKEKDKEWLFGQYPRHWDADDYYYENIPEDADEETKEAWTWNNKRWRCLYYINKDILCSGKSYPYTSDSLSKMVLDVIHELAEKNLGWKYQFGPQPYLDMRNFSFRNFYKLRDDEEFLKDKHCIFFETKGMYNDFLNANDYHTYYCYRNRVKKNKIFCLSGRALSISTAYPFLENEYGPDERPVSLTGYNERYGEYLNYLS